MSEAASAASIDDPDASPSMIERLERACDRFEAALKAGLRPRIEDHLGSPSAPGCPGLLGELLVLDLTYRRLGGEWPTFEEYRRRFPEAGDSIAAAFAAEAPATEPGSPPAEADAPGPGPGGPAPAVAGYEVLGELGRGGMGVVYKARQVRLNRTVALKMILAGAHASPEAGARFLAEAGAVARLQHPQIVQIFNIGDHDGHPYLEMEYVAGGSLADQLDGTPRPARAVAQLVESLARTIHEAHRLGIVHRDLKPANILLTADGLPKVTDFGLAKSLDSDSGLTRSDSILGSPSYMAPEQAGGRAKQVGPPADVYALGAIMYELLTGRPPFKAATVLQTLEQVKDADPVPPSRLQPDLPLDAETVCLTCLRKEPGRRYPSAEALADDLRRFLAREPIAARPVGATERAVKWARRRPAVAALSTITALSVVLLIVVLAATNVIIRHEQRQTLEALDREKNAREELVRVNARIAQQQRQTEEALVEQTGALRRETRRSYFQRIALAEREFQAGRVGLAGEILDECPAVHRGWEWHYLKRLFAGDRMTLRGHAHEVWDAAIGSQGRLLASASFDNTVKIWDAADGRQRLTLRGHSDRVYSVAFDPSDRRVVSASADHTVRVWDAQSGRPIHVLRGHTNNVRCAAFSPDARRIASAGWDGTLRIWDAGTGREVRTLVTNAGWITRLAFSPDGRRVALGGTYHVAEVWEVETGRHLQTFRGHSDHVLSVAFSPDGRRVASTSGFSPLSKTGDIRVWDAETGREILAIENRTGVVERVTFSPDGSRLATSGWDRNVKVWDAETGQEILGLRGHSDRVWGVAFSPDGRRIVSTSADGTIRLWNTNPPDGR